MSEVAYGKRDLSAIKSRSRRHLLYSGVRKLMNQIINRPVRSILVYPAVSDEKQLSDLLNRLAWGFPYKKNLSIFVTVSKNLEKNNYKSLSPPSQQRCYMDSLGQVFLVDENDAQKKLDSDLLLITKPECLRNPSIFRRLYKTMIIDPYYFLLEECNVWKQGLYSTYDKDEAARFKDLSVQNYSSLLEINKNKKKACCFATGPSFDRYEEFRYGENCFKVICNSTVKNITFLDHIKGPDLLVFADPVFHFSPCEYSAKFRDHVLETVRKYNCFIIVPDLTMPLLLSHYPDLENRLIGMPTTRSLNIPSTDKFYVKGSANILTLFMLPVASAVSNKVFIIGADGRNPDEKYFWKHSSSVQYDDLMETVFETHPSFFRDRDYKDYYDTHCKNLEKLLSYGESRGLQYHSLTPSYIPALRDRYIEIGEEQR